MTRQRTIWILGLGVLGSLAATIAAASAGGSPIRANSIERADRGWLLFAAFLVLALVVYLAALWLLRRRETAVALVFALAVVIQLVPLAGPLLISRDAYSYWAYARIVAVYHRDPFAVPPAQYPHDPATHAVAKGWRSRTSAYGPVFTAASVPVADVAGRSAERASLLFRVLASAASVGMTLLVALVATRKAYAVAFVGWNPIVALSFAGGGHNDAWMLVVMVGAIALSARRRDAAAGAAWAVAGAVKAAAFPLLLLQLIRSRGGVWLGATVVTFAIAAAATSAFGTSWLTSVWDVNRHEAAYALPARLEQLGVPERAAHVAAYLVLVVGAVWLARQARVGKPRLALGACLIVMTASWVLPWYSTWPIALAAIDDDGLGQLLALGVAFYLLPDRLPV